MPTATEVLWALFPVTLTLGALLTGRVVLAGFSTSMGLGAGLAAAVPTAELLWVLFPAVQNTWIFWVQAQAKLLATSSSREGVSTQVS